MLYFNLDYIAVRYNCQVKNNVFGKNLRELRRTYGYTQRYMAEFLGIAQPSYIRYENGSAEPNFDNLVRIAELFDVSADFLLGRADI